MRKLVFVLALFILIPLPVHAAEQTLPTVPASAEKYIPESPETFEEGLWEIVTDAISVLQPAISDAAACCAKLIATALMLSTVSQIKGSAAKTVALIGSLAVSALLLSETTAMTALAADSVTQLSDYGKLFVPIMTSAMAASGGGGSAVSLYTGTVAFDSILSSCISFLLLPLVQIYLVLSVANSAVGEGILIKLRDFAKWLMTWILKIILYVFTGYMSITKVVSGSADAAVLKATKLTISGMVPVVGGILSDASDSVLASAGIAKSTTGVYGLLAVIAVAVEPFLRIGVQYLMLKTTAALCAVFAPKEIGGLIQNFSTAMGLLLAMTGSVCLMLLISIVCFMKGVA